MKNIIRPEIEWEYTIDCDRCDTIATAEISDLKTDLFKRPGTYFFDGSADRMGMDRKFFVHCPACSNSIFIPKDAIPALLIRQMT